MSKRKVAKPKPDTKLKLNKRRALAMIKSIYEDGQIILAALMNKEVGRRKDDKPELSPEVQLSRKIEMENSVMARIDQESRRQVREVLYSNRSH